MPIKHLTSEARMPRIGKLRKGAAMQGKRPGADQAHFRFTSDEAHIEQAFNEVYPRDPMQLIVYMPYPTPDRCFPHFMEEHAASGLLRRCDGEHILLERREERIENLTSRCVPCCAGVGSSCECEPTGRLFLILPLIPIFGVVEMPTGSIHDIQNIHGVLVSAYSFAQMSGRSLLGIPFRLYRKAVEISTPAQGSRVKRTKHLVFLEPASEWTMLQLDLLDQRAADPAFWKKLPAHEADEQEPVDEETGEMVESDSGRTHAAREAEPHVEALSETIEKALRAATGSYGFYNGTRALMDSLFDLLCINVAPWHSDAGAQWITLALQFIETRIETPGERIKFAAWLVRGSWSTDSEAIDAVVVIEELITSFKQA